MNNKPTTHFIIQEGWKELVDVDGYVPLSRGDVYVTADDKELTVVGVLYEGSKQKLTYLLR